MTTKDTTHLGRALTQLGLEKTFLANGGLEGFGLADRGTITNDIIEAQLSAGRWDDVVRMMYGGEGHASALYDGSADDLRDAIVAAARKATPERMREDTLDALVSKREHDVLWRLVTGIPTLNDQTFLDARRRIPDAYFEARNDGNERKRTLSQLAGERALAGERYAEAAGHFENLRDEEGLDRVFDAALAATGSSTYGLFGENGLLEILAKRDPEKRGARLKALVCALMERTRDDEAPMQAFALYKGQMVPLDDATLRKLREQMVERGKRWEVWGNQPHRDAEDVFKNHPELQLAWAKRHAKKEPLTAYRIMRAQEHEGPEVTTAVQEGLKLSSEDTERRLHPGSVKEEHLLQSYDGASFTVRSSIALHLKDNKRLEALSREAKGRGDHESAYRLWMAGHGESEGDYIDGIRAQLISEALGGRWVRSAIFKANDTRGNTQLCDALLRRGARRGRKQGDYLVNAHELALQLGDEERLQKIRKRMTARDPRWALKVFSAGGNQSAETRDEAGIAYVVATVAAENGASPETLGELVTQYTALKK